MLGFNTQGVLFIFGQWLHCDIWVKYVAFLVAVADMKIVCQTWNKTLICGFVIGLVSAVPKKTEVAWSCETECPTRGWYM